MTLWIIVSMIVNGLIGVAVCCACDNEEGDLYRWYHDATGELGLFGPLINFLTPQFWPVILFIRIKNGPLQGGQHGR